MPNSPQIVYPVVARNMYNMCVFALEYIVGVLQHPSSMTIHFVKKVPGIDHSKSPLKEILKNLFDAKLAPLSSILT